MKILSMTATFGKLDHKTLTLQPGLNVIEAPNEWGKSTWCAFVVAMLYGISTSSRKKSDFLPDKERYAPWCGKPMAGRMDICWQGKNITIERSQKGRIPFGSFRAYETETNVDVEGLTADNCGSVLLGVEREVFTRAGFLKGSDLPVGEDEALRRRLNALVTTGDESNASDALAQKLKKLKNDCKFNRSGLIPQAESQRDQLQDKLDQIETLKIQTLQLQERENIVSAYAEQLKNHQVALAYERSLQSQAHVEKANGELQTAKEQLQALDAQCADLPTAQTARQELERLTTLQQQMLQLQDQETDLPDMPQKPEAPTPFVGKDPQMAMQQAKSDRDAYKMLCKPVTPTLLIFALLLVGAGIGMLFIKPLVSLPCGVVAVVLLALFFKNKKAQAEERQAVVRVYGNEDADGWVTLAQDYGDRMAAYQLQLQNYQGRIAAYDSRKGALQQTMELLTGGKRLAQSMENWQQILMLRQQQKDAKERCERASAYAQTVSALAQTAPKPERPDTLTLSEAQTEQALQQTTFEQKQLHQRLGQHQGQMETLGDKALLEQQLAQVQERLMKLEDYYAALSLAQDALTQAATELQRRFAPRISARARELFAKLTDNRYDRLLLASDLSMEVAAQDEDTPHGVLWRSDGTVDQLYLALRLAVAEELTPNVPLVLDDAFVRFDDKRVKAAMEILKEYAEHKQVILFTCQTREQQFAD